MRRFVFMNKCSSLTTKALPCKVINRKHSEIAPVTGSLGVGFLVCLFLLFVWRQICRQNSFFLVQKVFLCSGDQRLFFMNSWRKEIKSKPLDCVRFWGMWCIPTMWLCTKKHNSQSLLRKTSKLEKWYKDVFQENLSVPESVAYYWVRELYSW